MKIDTDFFSNDPTKFGYMRRNYGLFLFVTGFKQVTL